MKQTARGTVITSEAPLFLRPISDYERDQIGEALRSASVTGSNVKAFGQAMSLLWSLCQVPEEMLAELAQTYEASAALRLAAIQAKWDLRTAEIAAGPAEALPASQLDQALQAVNGG